MLFDLCLKLKGWLFGHHLLWQSFFALFFKFQRLQRIILNQISGPDERLDRRLDLRHLFDKLALLLSLTLLDL